MFEKYINDAVINIKPLRKEVSTRLKIGVSKIVIGICEHNDRDTISLIFRTKLNKKQEEELESIAKELRSMNGIFNCKTGIDLGKLYLDICLNKINF